MLPEAKALSLVVSEVTAESPEWDEIAARYGTVFHTQQWLDLMERSFNARLRRVVFTRDGRLVGILPLFTQWYFPFRVAASPLVPESSPILGIACESHELSAAVAAVGEYASRNGLHFLRLFQRESFAEKDRDTSFDYIEKHTHVIDLTLTEEFIWSGMEGRCRTAIRKAEKNGVIVTQERERHALTAFYDVFERLYSGQNMASPCSLEFFEGLWDRYHANGLRFLLARLDGKIIAGALLLQSNQRVYYLFGASLSEFNSLSPNNLVQWTGVQLAKSEGATKYDFVGSDIERLAKFKKSFGGGLEGYTLLERSSSEWVAYVRRRVPAFKSYYRDIRSKLWR